MEENAVTPALRTEGGFVLCRKPGFLGQIWRPYEDTHEAVKRYIASQSENNATEKGEGRVSIGRSLHAYESQTI